MISLPDPLHPAIVHFPVVLILIGSAAAVVALFWRGHHVPLYAAVLLALGAIGAWVAVETGESDGGLLEQLPPAAAAMLDAHENWAERTLTFAAIAAAAAIAAVTLGRFQRTARLSSVLAAVVALAAAYGVYQTGHRGGALVFQHRAGVQAVAATEAAPAAPLAQHSREERD